MQPIVSDRKAEIAAICRRFGVRRLEVFGSAARDDFDPARSDVDFLVEFEPGFNPSLFCTYFGVKDALEALFGRRVDLLMAGQVENPYVRADIDRSRETVFAA
jgi:uncharacterized protein